MATAEAVTASGFVSPADFDDNVRQVVRLLMAAEGISSLEDLGERASISKSTMYDRMKKNTFTGKELSKLAEALHAPPSVFFERSTILRARITTTDRYVANAQVRAALDLVHYVGSDQLTLDDAPRYDRPTKPVLVPIAS